MSAQSVGDGTASMQVPQGWNLLGGQGQALCLSQDGSCGFTFAITNFWDRSRIPRFDNSGLPGLHRSYTKPIDAVALVMQEVGSTSIQAESRWANPERAREAQASTNRLAESETAVLRYKTKAGVTTLGYYDALTLAPNLAGQWLVLYWGVWAPQPTFESMLNTLVPMAASYRVNQQWASNYIQQGLARLRQLQAQTQAAVTDAANHARETNLAIFQEKMRSGDYLDYKRTATIRGEQEWVSNVEGGALYKSDHWGLSREGEQISEGQDVNYNNFQGENPVYRENMTPVDASREVFERVYPRR